MLERRRKVDMHVCNVHVLQPALDWSVGEFRVVIQMRFLRLAKGRRELIPYRSIIEGARKVRGDDVTRKRCP